MTGRSATLVIMVAAVVVTATTMGPNAAPRLIWNASDSVPTGLYHVQPALQLNATTLVVAYPPEPLATYLADSGYLPRGVPLIKHVLALPGQTVCRTGLTITVDEIDVGAARERDRRGRSLPVWQGCRVVAAGEVFLMNRDEPASPTGGTSGRSPCPQYRPRRTALDIRDALAMQPRCTPGAAPLWGAGHRSSSFPVRFHAARLRNGCHRTPDGTGTSACLAPNLGECGGTPFGARTTNHLQPE